MFRTRVKLCGMVRPQDALHAARAGADAVGLVFHAPAKRNVTVERARDILHQLPAFVTPVGLFVDRPVQEMTDIAARLGLTTLQLHGHEPPAVVKELSRFSVIKAVRASRATLAQDLHNWRDAVEQHKLTNLKAILLETPSTAQAGGTGVANDWDLTAEFQRAGAFDGLPPIILAGGLTPETVYDVVRKLKPYAVDVSSGIEQVVGEKSVDKMNQFIDEVRRADA